jgi:hypothetical protein
MKLFRISSEENLRNTSTTDQIFCIRRYWGEQREYKWTLQQLFIDFKKAYVSVKYDVLYNIPLLSYTFVIQRVWNKEIALLSFHFSFSFFVGFEVLSAVNPKRTIFVLCILVEV